MVSLPWSVPLTRADLDRMPDDGHRYELLDGALLVTPAPGTRHQVCVVEVALPLRLAADGRDLVVLVAPFDVAFSDFTVLEPDVVVVRRADLDDRGTSVAPRLVVEVLSPSTRKTDLGTKRLAYEGAGVEWYWIVDPAVPGLTVLHLEDGRYVEEARVEGEQAYTATAPLSVTIVPSDLLKPLTGGC